MVELNLAVTGIFESSSILLEGHVVSILLNYIAEPIQEHFKQSVSLHNDPHCTKSRFRNNLN